MLLHPADFPRPESIAEILVPNENKNWDNISPAVYEQTRARVDIFSAIAATRTGLFTVTDVPAPDQSSVYLYPALTSKWSVRIPIWADFFKPLMICPARRRGDPELSRLTPTVCDRPSHHRQNCCHRGGDLHNSRRDACELRAAGREFRQPSVEHATAEQRRQDQGFTQPAGLGAPTFVDYSR